MASNKVNRPVVLKRTNVQIALAGRAVQAPATAVLQLSPRPRAIVEVELDYSSANDMRERQSVNVRLDQGRMIRATVGDSWLIQSRKVSNFLIPAKQPVTVLDLKKKMSRCKFALINFPHIWGEKDIHWSKKVNGETRQFVTPRFQLQAYPWDIDIRGDDSVMSLHHKMEREGGSAITHVGTIARLDGRNFSVKDLKFFLGGLHLFLSFARGSYCGVTLLSGQDSNRERVWQQWGTYKVEPYQRRLSTWIHFGHSEMLSSVFAGFWNQFSGRNWKDATSKAIHWYLRSNESNEFETSIILTYAALERLSYAIVGAKRPRTKQGEWIAKTLNQVGVPLQIPKSCKELVRLQKQLNWSDGPHALVELRNDLIHPKNKIGGISTDAHAEGWELGQWYVELMLLNLFGHNGQYVSRLKRRRGRSRRFETVPWAKR